MLKLSPRRERERQQHIRHIQSVAESLFSEQGFFRVTMRQIAIKAEFALGTVYSYFGNKRQLYQTVIETKVIELIDAVTEEMMATSSDQDKIRRFISIKLSFLRRNPAFIRLFLAEVYLPQRDSGHILPVSIRKRYDSMLRDLTGVIERGIREGLLKPMEAEVIATTLDSVTNAFALSWLVSEEHIPVETDIETVTELFFYGVALESGTSRKSE